MQGDQVKEILLGYIRDNMDAFYDDSELKEDDNIFEKGYVSSLFAIRLLNFIEEKLEIIVPDDMIKLKNFSSVNNMMVMIQELKGGLSDGNE